MGQSAADLKARVTGGTPTFKQYYNEAYRKRIFGEAASTPAEKRAMDAIGDFYDHWETVRKGVGQIGRAKKLATEIGVVEIRLTKLQARPLSKLHAEGVFLRLPFFCFFTPRATRHASHELIRVLETTQKDPQYTP